MSARAQQTIAASSFKTQLNLLNTCSNVKLSQRKLELNSSDIKAYPGSGKLGPVDKKQETLPNY
jgi:hypothetical protein